MGSAESTPAPEESSQSLPSLVGSSASAPLKVPLSTSVAKTTTVYRAGSNEEMLWTKRTNGLIAAGNSSDQNPVKWMSETPRYQKDTLARCKPTVAIDVNRQKYNALNKTLVDLGTKDKIQGFNLEGMAGSSLGRRNIGIADIEDFNQMIYKIRSFQRADDLSASRVVRFFQQNKTAQLSAGGAALSVVFDGVNIVLAVINEDGTPGPQTVAAIASSGINLLGPHVVSSALAALVPSLAVLSATLLGCAIVALISAGVSAAILFGWQEPHAHHPRFVPTINFEDIEHLAIPIGGQYFKRSIFKMLSDIEYNSPQTMGSKDAEFDSKDIEVGMESVELVVDREASSMVVSEKDVIFGTGYPKQGEGAIRWR